MMKNWKKRREKIPWKSWQSSFWSGVKGEAQQRFSRLMGSNVSIVAQAINFFRIVIESAKELSQLRESCVRVRKVN